MSINYLRLTKIATNLTLFTFLIFAIGLTFSIIDELLDWDILPDLIEKYAQLIIISFGVFSTLFIVSSLVCGLTAIAELLADKRDQSSEPMLSRRKSLVVGIIIIGFISALLIFQEIDTYRKQAIFVRDAENFAQRLTANAQQLEKALMEVLPIFPQALLHKIRNQTILADTEALKDFLVAMSLTIPENPEVKLLMRAEAPYHYRVISVIKKYDYTHEIDQYQLHEQPYILFSKDLENQTITNLFKEKRQPLTQPLKGDCIDNTEPSSWGVLKLEEQIVAILVLKKTIDAYYVNKLRKKQEFYHRGPASIHTNF